ncbi:hypothetical protein D3C78_1477840 [compost metagenome]
MGAGVALGHVRGTLDMAGQNMVDSTNFFQGSVERIDCGSGDTECGIDTFTAQHQNGGLDCSHFGHCVLLRTGR